MKRGKNVVWIAVCAIIVCCIGLAVWHMQSEPRPGKLIYVKSHGETADVWTYQLVEQNIMDGAETILREGDSEIFLIDSPQGDMYYGAMDGHEMLTVYDVQSGAAVWQGDASEISEPQQYVFSFDGDYLYYSEERQDDAEYVMRLGKNGQSETLARIEYKQKMWISCFSISPDGKIACMREERIAEQDGASRLYSYVWIYENGVGHMVAEGTCPRWINENELFFMQDDSLMIYQNDSSEIRNVQAENGRAIKLASDSLLTAPVPNDSEGYLVYTINTTGTSSMPNHPDVGVTSIKDGSTFCIKRVGTDQFGNQKIFVILD